MPVRAFVAIGSNLDPARHVREAIRRLALRQNVVAVSTVYRTPAIGRPDDPDYYNCVVELSTDTPPEVLKKELFAIESDLGRVRWADKYAPRNVDLDLVLYGSAEVQSEDLLLPSPDISVRAFVAIPLAELAPDLVLPDGERRLAEVAAGFGMRDMMPLAEYTALLRRDIQRAVQPGENRTAHP